jgi:hypothetical protein
MAACKLISLVTVPAGEAIFTVADYCIAACFEDAPFARIWQASSFTVILPPNYFLLKHMKSGFVLEVNCSLESMLPRFISYDNLFIIHANCLLESIPFYPF